MTAEIICVGTELLLGDIVNTNAQFLSRELAELGISVLHQQVVGDNAVRLKELVGTARARSDLLVFSGGLGPTADDLTKETVAEAFCALMRKSGRRSSISLPAPAAPPPPTTASRPWCRCAGASCPTPTAPPPAPGSRTRPAAAPR